jgi:hypothetical protein
MDTASSVRVRFIQSNRGILSLLEIDTPRRSDSYMRQVDKALFDLRVQVVGAESQLSPTRRLERLSVVEFDGAPIRSVRQLEIQVEVLRALDSARPRSAPNRLAAT